MLITLENLRTVEKKEEKVAEMSKVQEIDRTLAFIAAWPTDQTPGFLANCPMGWKLVEFFENWEIERGFESSFPMLKRCLEHPSRNYGEWLSSTRLTAGRNIGKNN